MAGYWIVRSAQVKDAEAMQEYGKLWPDIAAQFGAELIAGKDRVETREGPQFARQLIVRFESYEQALACYDSAGYAPAKSSHSEPLIANWLLSKVSARHRFRFPEACAYAVEMNACVKGAGGARRGVDNAA